MSHFSHQRSLATELTTFYLIIKLGINGFEQQRNQTKTYNPVNSFGLFTRNANRYSQAKLATSCSTAVRQNTHSLHQSTNSHCSQQSLSINTIVIITLCASFLPWPMCHLSAEFYQNRSSSLCIILLTSKQTNANYNNFFRAGND